MRLTVFAAFIFLLSASQNPVQAQLNKTAVDDFDNYTIVGEMGLTVTNFGILGEGWNNPDQPSARYKQYGTEREMVELMSYAGLWLGGIPVVNGLDQPARVSTAIVDGAFDSGDEGFEFATSSAASDTIHTRSSISSASTSPLASYFSLDAVSHQDLITTFSDLDAEIAPNHLPLGIEVHLESYAWSHSFMESFVILDYTITNKSNQVDTTGEGWDIKNIYAGIWADASVNNMNYKSRWEPGSGFSWYDNINSFERSYNNNGYPRNIGYQYDYDGDDGWSQVYFGIMALHGPNRRSTSHADAAGNWHIYYNQWRWNSPENMDFPDLNMPISDVERYQKLASSPYNDQNFVQTYEELTLRSPNSWMMLVSAGPFGTQPDNSDFILPVGESINVVFAVLGAPWSHQGSANDVARREDLVKNADWAQKAFNGEDVNGNSVLDSGEDLNENGVLDRYIVPEPPPSPSLAVIAADQKVTLYWDNAPESVLDPVSRKHDFAGYRIYGSAKTSGNEEQYSLLAEFDLLGDEFGYDTGFDLVQIKNEAGIQDSVLINNHYYHYAWVNEGVQNGWPNNTNYAITAYDSGDENTGLASLESSRNENRTNVIPGTIATDDMAGKPASVYPNPYRTKAGWDGNGQRNRLIWFRNLPEQSTIRIYTLGGDLIDEIDHDSNSYQGGDISRLPVENTVYAGGEHAWDLITKHDEPIATGMYVFTVENENNGDVQVGKFLVIK
jgi:hypothetical protein